MNNFEHIQEWLRLPDESKLTFYIQTGRQAGLPAIAIEKDWWVVHTLSIIFSMKCSSALIFKGGTSLSKAWNLIQRFSEDVDLVLDREYLGFTGELSKGDIRKLRRKSYQFITTEFITELKDKFSEAGFKDAIVKYREVENHDQDPLIIEIYYPKLTEKDTYLKPGVLVEIGSRSLKEPFTHRTFSTIASEIEATHPFSDKPITIPTVNPERTFLEKIFLLHEEFQKPPEKIRVERLSRHLYDIEKLMQTPYAEIALGDFDLYNTIVAHRSKFTPIGGIDYAKHTPENIKFVPPTELLPLWERDYQEMKENMIYGEPLEFDILIKRISELQKRINTIKHP